MRMPGSAMRASYHYQLGGMSKMRQDSRPARLASLLSFAKEQLILARVAGQAERSFYSTMISRGSWKFKQSARRRWLWAREEAKQARKYVRVTLIEIEKINGQLYCEGSAAVEPLCRSLNGKNFHSWWAEFSSAKLDIWGGFN